MTQTNFNPYIGLRTYAEADAEIFRGRATATAELYRLIVDNDVVVLHAESGEGKSSLLNAGLFPLLREERYFPISISFTEEDFALENPDFNEIVYRRILDTVNHSKDSEAGVAVKIEPLASGKTGAAQFPGLEGNVWWLLRNYSLTAFGAQLTPILVFDQFEEVFTRPKYISWTEEFFIWLATTLSDSIPPEVSAYIREKIGPDAEFPRVNTQKRFKALFAQRTEYMGDLDYWGIQRHAISVLKNSRYCLKSLTENEADDVLALQPAFTAEMREKLKSAICSSQRTGRHYSGNLPFIPAMLLSVVSTTASANLDKQEVELNEIGNQSDKKSQEDIFIDIIEQFYDKEIADTRLPKKDIVVIEDVLVDENGKRVRIKADVRELKAIDFENKYKSVLEQKRLLKCTRINGAEYVELTHDALARVVMRKRRQRKDARANSTKLALFGGLMLMAVLSLMIWVKSIGLFVGGSDSLLDLKACDLALTQFSLLKELGCALLYFGIGFAVFRLSKRRKELSAICIQTVGYYLLLAVATLAMRYFYLPSLGYSFLGLFHGVGEYYIIKVNYLNIFWAALFAIGNFLCRKNKLLKVIGIAILCFTLLIPLYAIPWIGLILLLSLSVFGLAAYSLMQERNGMWFSIMGIAVVLITFIGFSDYFEEGMRNEEVAFSFFIIILSLLVFCIYSARMPKKRSLAEAWDIVISGEVFRGNDRLRKLLCCFIGVIIIFTMIIIGAYANLGISLIVVPLLSLALYAVMKPRWLQQKLWAKIAVPCIIYLSVLAIGLAYFSIWQLYIISAVYVASFIALYCASANSLSRIVMWIIIVISILGYSINPTTNDTYLVSMQAVEDVSGTRLLPVKDRMGRYGLRDRRGDMVIDCQYDTVIPFYDPAETQGALAYILKKDDRYILWRTDNHLLETNALTNEYVEKYIKNNFQYTLNRPTAYDDDDLQKSKLILAAVKARNSKTDVKKAEADAESSILSNILWELNSTKQPEDYYYELDFKDTQLGKELSKVDFARIKLDLLPYTSENFQVKFLTTVLPALKFLGSMTVGTILSSDENPEEFATQLENIDFNIRTVSNQANLEDYGHYRLGELYTRLASYFLETGDYDQSLHFSDMALKYGAYSEPAVVDNMIAANLAGDTDAFERLMKNPLELVRINRGPTYPNPELDDAWVYLRYRPVYDLVATRIAQLQLPQYIAGKDLDKAKEALDKISRGEDFSNPSDMPYTAVQLIPDSLGGGRRYFGGFLADNSYGRSVDAIREYSFFVKDGEITAGPMMCYSLAKDDPAGDAGSPILVIDYLTKKRRYIKADHSIIGARSGAPEYLPGEYTHAWPFSDGLAAVEIDGKIGFIDETGAIVIEPQYTPNYPVGDEIEKRFLDIYVTPRGRRGEVLYKKPYFNDGVCTVYEGKTELEIRSEE